MSVLNRIMSTARGAAARGTTARRPAGRGAPAGRRPAPGGRNATVERGVRSALSAFRRRR